MTILIAEDQATNRKLASVVLKAKGYTVVEVNNGQEALDWLSQITEPTLSLLDWNMPVMDGVTVCRRIRAKPNLPPLYIILLTVKDTEEDITTGLLAGANDYITKPFNHVHLLERIHLGLQKISAEP